MLLSNEAAKIETLCNIYTKDALDCYKYFNKEVFEDFETISLFSGYIKQLCIAHNQFPTILYRDVNKPTFVKNNKVLLCFSGGLDSVYQALKLREQNYEVILFHIINLNYYTNGKEKEVVQEFAKEYNFELITAKISPIHKSEYKKHWNENSFKNCLIYSMAIDHMLSYGIGNLSSGDDLRLSIKDHLVGTNTGDCYELTKALINDFGVSFIPVDGNINKAERLKYVYEKGANNLYNSCVGPGRLITMLNTKYSKFYNINTDKWNCLTCRKCCMHILLNYYYNGFKYPEELIERCWDKVSIGADNVFFDKSIPLDIKIKNLIKY